MVACFIFRHRQHQHATAGCHITWGSSAHCSSAHFHAGALTCKHLVEPFMCRCILHRDPASPPAAGTGIPKPCYSGLFIYYETEKYFSINCWQVYLNLTMRNEHLKFGSFIFVSHRCADGSISLSLDYFVLCSWKLKFDSVLYSEKKTQTFQLPSHWILRVCWPSDLRVVQPHFGQPNFVNQPLFRTCTACKSAFLQGSTIT